MAISFRCASCQHPYEVRAELAGKRGRCKRCGGVFTIPGAEPGIDPVVAPSDRDALDDDEPLRPVPASPAEAPHAPTRKRKKARRTAGLIGLERLPLWGFGLYLTLIVGLGVASLLATGERQQILGIGAMVLGLGPIFVGLLLNSNQGVAFRDGLFPGLAYMFILPYRIYYRATRPDVFRNHLPRKLTAADLVLILVALGTVVTQYYAAIERDRKPQRGPEPFHGGMPRPPAIVAAPAPPAPGPGPGIAPRPAFGMPSARSFRPPDFDDGPRPGVTPPDSQASVPGAGVAPPNPFPVPPAFPALPAVPPPSGPDPTKTVTIIVSGLPDPAGVGRIQETLTALIDRAGRGHSIQFSSNGNQATFLAGPIADPNAFAAQIRFGRVTSVKDRTINVEATP